MSRAGLLPPAALPGSAPAPASTGTGTALYEGTLRHRRHHPRTHRLRARLFLAWLDLDTVDEDLARVPWWSATRWALLRFRPADFFDGRTSGLADAVRDLVADRLGARPDGPVCLLANVRTAGWLFNPLSTYVCFAADRSTPRAIVFEVTNTPWGERCWYVVPAGPDAPPVHDVPKVMHVSPFFEMAQTYRIRVRGVGEDRLSVRFENFEQLDGPRAPARKVFDADLTLRRVPLDRRTARRVPLRHPLQPLAVSASIYLHALVLFAKRVPFVPHPRRTPTAPGVPT